MSNIQKIQNLNDVFKKILAECPELTFVGDKVLREKTVEVSLEEGLKVAEKLKVTLSKYRSIAGYGRGLAAPQIGENRSVFVTYVNDQFQVYINPKIIKKSDSSNFYREGCLSCGYVWADVKRSKAITMEYMDEKGEVKSTEADGFLARLLQHEHDHLLGIVNIDIAESGSIEFMTDDPLKEQLRDEPKS